MNERVNDPVAKPATGVGPSRRARHASHGRDRRAGRQPRLHSRGPLRSMGVEEEFHLVDLRTRRLAPRAAAVLAHLDEGVYAAELQNCVVETRTGVVLELAELREDCLLRRRELVEAAGRLGLGVVAAGTVPLAVPAELDVTKTPRYSRMLYDYQLLAREQLICGTHVHVEIPDRDQAAAVAERVAPHLPTLLALSASSPFRADGSDTGYASSRTLTWTRWPTTGLSAGAPTAEAYDELVGDLVRCGVITDPGMIYFDLRLAAAQPTLELRICDACPSVDTIVLIAGLFRALVGRAVAQIAAREPAVPLRAALGRAATWRAARSGLEGDLVDLASLTARPAAEVVRSLVASLEPQLRRTDDWDTVATLADSVLAAGSSAARQLRAFRRRGRLADVVDLLVAETAASGPALTSRAAADELLAGYSDPLTGPLPVMAAEPAAEPVADPAAAAGAPPARPREERFVDEAVAEDGTVRPEYEDIIATLRTLGPAALRQRDSGIATDGLAKDATFKVHDQARPRVLAVDVVPRVIDGDDWAAITAGAAQRARALDLFIRDVYGPRQIEADGVIPPDLLDRVPGYRSSGRLGGRSVRAHVCGLDLVQGALGQWMVLEDNVRIPSGTAYALENRDMVSRHLPELAQRRVPGREPGRPLDVSGVPATLAETLRAAAPTRCAGEPAVALLSSGPADSAYPEHRYLAGHMGVPLVLPHELVIDDDGAWIVRGEERTRVDVLYARIDADMLLSSTAADGRRLRDGLVDVLHRGQVTIANALGNGVADDKAVYAFVPAMIEYYLGEKPLLASVPTYLCADREQRDHVLAHLDALVTKPVDGYGGLGVVVGPDASEEALAVRARELADRPEAFIAQDVVALSTHPTFDGTSLRPRHVDLRVFVHLRPGPGPRSVSTPPEAVVLPAALTRVAPPGSRIVNSSAGGGSKDTWIMPGPADGRPARTRGE